MKLYKHIKPVDLPHWRNGSIRISTLNYFRNAEKEDVGIGDKLEGASATALNLHIQSGRLDDEVNRIRLEKLGLKIGPGAVVFDTCQLVSRGPEHYILCLSKVSTPGHFGEDRSIVLRIASSVELFSALNKAMPIPGKVGSMGPVVYANEVTEFTFRDPPKPHPLLKRPSFAYQQEYRFYWPAKNDGPQFRDVRSDKIAALLAGWNPELFGKG